MTQSIEKLQKKLAKDPNSLIFFQLAEEYRKQGNLEEALPVLKAGLTRHPNYWSARVTLGRIYHQMGNTALAREELEKVIQAVPDNLLANRLLGDIYAGLKLPMEALKRYTVVHMLTPGDQDVAAYIKRLEAEIVESQPELKLLPEVQIDPQPEPAGASLEVSGQMPAEEPEEEVYAPTIQIQIPDFLEKTEVPGIASLVESVEPILGTDTYGPDTTLDAVILPKPMIDESVAEGAAGLTDNPMLPDTIIIEPAENRDEVPPEPLENHGIEYVEPNRDAEELSSLAGLLLAGERPSVEEHEFGELEAELEKAAPFETEEFIHHPQQDRTQPIGPGEEQIEEAEELTSETLAELYLNQGFVDKAVRVYQRLLLNDPENMHIHQRLQEITSDDSTAPQIEPAFQEEPVMIARQDDPLFIENPAHEEVTRRAQLRQRKISMLEGWLTTIRREQD